jgi:hypothetical protein
MEDSPELKEITLRMYEAASEGDASFMDRISSQRALLVIGSDPEEWWTDPVVMSGVFKAQAESGIKISAREISAYQEGSVGWVAARSSFVLPDGTEMPFRWTGVFHQEDGDWKLVQGHGSIGVSNEEALGTDLKG